MQSFDKQTQGLIGTIQYLLHNYSVLDTKMKVMLQELLKKVEGLQKIQRQREQQTFWRGFRVGLGVGFLLTILVLFS